MPGHPVVIGGVAVLVVFAALVFLPLPWVGLNYYNVTVTTTISETCVFGICSYGVSSVNPSVSGPATVIDLGGLFGIGLGVAPPCINCQYKITASLSNGQSASASETKFISSVFTFNQQDTLNLAIAYVPGASYNVQVTVVLQGSQVASGSGSIVVP